MFFKSKFVIDELKTATEYKINIITLWDKNNCPDFPNKEELDDDIKYILNKQSIPWLMQKNVRKSAIKDIIDNMNKGFNNLFNFIPENKFKKIEVDKENTIKYILEENKIKFNIGKVFYQIIKKEKIGTNKEIILIDKKTGYMYNGDYIREFLKLKPSNFSTGYYDFIEPDNNLDYDVFIQSNSSGRKIKKGYKIICENVISEN